MPELRVEWKTLTTPFQGYMQTKVKLPGGKEVSAIATMDCMEGALVRALTKEGYASMIKDKMMNKITVIKVAT